MGARSSARIRAHHNADDSQLVRAAALAERRDYYSGTPAKTNSILSLSDKQIKDRAAKLGVSLGVTEKRINDSVLSLKKTDLDRSVNILQTTLKDKGAEQPFSLVINRVSALTEDLEEEEMDRSLDGESGFPVTSMEVKRTRKRKVYSSLHKRRSARINSQSKRKNA